MIWKNGKHQLSTHLDELQQCATRHVYLTKSFEIIGFTADSIRFGHLNFECSLI